MAVTRTASWDLPSGDGCSPVTHAHVPIWPALMTVWLRTSPGLIGSSRAGCAHPRVQDCTALPQGTLLLSHRFFAADPSARRFLAAYTLACSAYSGRSCSWRAVPGPGWNSFLFFSASTWRAVSRPRGVAAPGAGARGGGGGVWGKPGVGGGREAGGAQAF